MIYTQLTSTPVKLGKTTQNVWITFIYKNT